MSTAKEQGTETRKALESLQNLRNRSVYIETYGCRFNFGDTAKLVEVLRSQGCFFRESPDDAEVIIMNTCTVVGPTERRMLRRLAGFRDRDLIVTGCMPRVQREAILSVCSPVIIDPEIIQELYRPLGSVAGGGIGIVQLAQGCSGTCTYCITRFARGPLKSFPKKEILSQVRAFIRAGVREIQLTAQDVSAWGQDTGDSLPELLTALDRIPGQHRIRVGMMNPATVKGQTGDLIDAFSGDHIFRFIHIPVQSGSDGILRRMGRDYTVAEFEGIVSAFRQRYPEITVATDMIVGFCGESPADFQASLDLIRRVRPAKVNVTRFSRRPFTPVSRKEDFPDHIKKDRSRAMNAVAEEVYSAMNGAQIGRTVPFTVTELLRKGSVMARSPEYTGIVLREDLPVGFCGKAILKADRKYFFIGERVS
ncbi:MULTISPECIES: radical SAM protein [unclassified Methanoregula]|uniref:radical SAM protein n=1 Tax=unclassified Methanoregula TaxID=2649730 RepID=UPI0009C648D0|nr:MULTISPECIES: radical SAM protein [unclassified Methanoregula]OPX61637.1 MAG: coproporphyrinogen III oxidase [Methanoregula sp. PtaB.Bin085]OPY34054.1 MAG: coproporphyrinogen III oxidase [Methanoregula sp. PtaU1.Bin006]